jgi:exonuclease III
MRFGGKGRQQWSKIIENHDPDVILAQETYAPQEHLPPLFDGDLHQHAVWHPVAEQPWGSAVFVKSCIPRPISLPDFSGNVVGAEMEDWPWLDSPGSRLRIFSVHAPKRGDYQKAVNSILDMILDVADGCDVVIGGDFNLTVSERHSSEPLTTSAADRAIQLRLQEEFGLINCWQTANPDKRLTQTLRWTRDRETNFHCDGIFVPKSWAGRLLSCHVLAGTEWDDLSDHNPVAAEFQ